MSQKLSYEKRGSIGVITLDDGKANALSPDMLADINAALDGASDAKAIVLCGREGRFSAGFDLRVMMSGPDAATAMVKSGGELLLRLYELPQPLVIACTGHAVAAGALVVATGDTRIGVVGDFKIGLNEVQNSMPVPILAHALAEDRLVAGELVASVLQSKMYDGEGAVAAGWLDLAVAASDLESAVMEEAERLAKLPAGAYAATKKSLRRRTVEYIRSTIDTNLAQLTGRK